MFGIYILLVFVLSFFSLYILKKSCEIINLEASFLWPTDEKDYHIKKIEFYDDTKPQYVSYVKKGFITIYFSQHRQTISLKYALNHGMTFTNKDVCETNIDRKLEYYKGKSQHKRIVNSDHNSHYKLEIV